MSTTAELIYEWLAASGPAKVDAIRAGLPAVNPKTVSDLLSRLRRRDMITRGEDGTWAAVIIEAPELDPAAALGALHALREDLPTLAPLHWLEMLGAEVPEMRCDGTCEIGCSNPPWRYTGDHTAVICPECGPECWDISPVALRRVEAHEAGERAKSARTGAASVALPQAELDRLALELNRRKLDALAEVRGQLARPEVRGEVRHDLTWLESEYERADTGQRLDQLDEVRGELRLPRRPFGTVLRGIFARDADEDEIVDAELVYDDEDQGDEEGEEFAELGEAAPVVAGPVFTSALCGPCYDSGARTPAAARIRSSRPAVVPERDVCLDHLRYFGERARSVPGIEVEVVVSYGPPAFAGIRKAIGA